MKSIFKTIFIVLLISQIFNAQVPKKILMEYATNASCGPCASANPSNYEFLKENYKNTIAVWYHSWWPGENDPMYQANIDENKARISYYSVNAVPRYIINGQKQGYGDETDRFLSHHSSESNLLSPIELKIEKNITNDSLITSVTLKVLAEVSLPNLVLHTAITEQNVIYSKAPGSNGEKEFAHVFRKFCAGSSGEALPSLNIGDSLTYTYKEVYDTTWNKDAVTMVAWVQSHSSKEILQAATDLFFYNIKPGISEPELITMNSTKQKDYSIENILEYDINLRVKISLNHNAEEWPHFINYNGNQVDSFDVSLAAGEIVNFELIVQTNNNTGHIDIDIIADNLGESPNFISKVNYFGFITSGDVLIVDDDGDADYEKNYTRVLSNLNVDFTKLSGSALEKVSSLVDVNSYKYIFWNLGISSPSLNYHDATMLIDYLDSGGRLFIAGQDLGYDIHKVSKVSIARFFYSLYLDALYTENTDSSTSVVAVNNNPIFENLSFNLNETYPLSPDIMESKRGNSIPILKFSDSENTAMLAHIKGDAKVVYSSFGLEQIESEVIQDSLILGIIQWFDIPTGIKKAENSTIPSSYNLKQNYPNPFNPTTSITYSIPKTGSVKIVIYDMLGKKIKTLVNKNHQPGNYNIEFDASELGSGVYIYTIKSNQYFDAKKMMLLK